MESRADSAVLHITKYKKLRSIGRSKSSFHEELKHTLGTTINPSLTHLKEDFAAYTHLSIDQAVEEHIAAGYIKKKAICRDDIKALGLILSGNHERIKEIEANKQLFDAWKKANYESASREFDSENIVRFTLHFIEVLVNI